MQENLHRMEQLCVKSREVMLVQVRYWNHNNKAIRTDRLFYPGHMAKTSREVVSSSYYQNEEDAMYIETGCLIQLASSTKVNHATMVTTLQLKQPIYFYSG